MSFSVCLNRIQADQQEVGCSNLLLCFECITISV